MDKTKAFGNHGPMKATCVVPVYNRPHYLKRNIETLGQCQEILNGTIKVIFVVEPSSVKRDVLKVLKGCHFPRSIIENKERLGLGRNLINCREIAFSGDSDIAWIIEDDYLPNPDYFMVTENVLKWAQSNGYPVGVINSNILCVWDLDTKIKRQADCNAIRGSFVNYLITRKAWESVRSILLDYEDRFLKGRDYKHIHTPNIRKWFIETWERFGSMEFVNGFPEAFQFSMNGWIHACRTQDGTFPAGQDACSSLSLRCKGITSLCLLVNRGLFIGETGEHSSPKWFHSTRHNEVVQSRLPGDASLKEFRLSV